MVKNLPSNAGDVGSIPGGGTKIPHAMGQLSPRATTTELMGLNERVHVPQTTEPTCHNEREARGPQQKVRTPQRRILRAATKTQHSPKN